MKRFLLISDVHLGHRKNKTIDITTNMKTIITENIKQFDCLIFSGDLFDSLLDFPSVATVEVIEFFDWLLRMAIRYEFVIRSVEGTPSHDWRQTKHLVTMNNLMGDKVDLKHVDKLWIEENEEHNLSILYIPDEWRIDTSDTLREVKELLSQHNLEKVNIIIMHGQFQYQLPEHIENIPRHNEYEYLKLVTDFIVIGHIHTHSSFRITDTLNPEIIVPGSFDRLRHNEEEPKGCVLKELDKPFKFIENRNAKIFKTIDVSNLDIESSNTLIRKEIKKYPTDSYIRVRFNSDHELNSNFSELKFEFNLYNLEKEIKKKRNKKEKEIKLSNNNNFNIELNRRTINKEIIKELESMNLTKKQESKINRLINNTIEEM